MLPKYDSIRNASHSAWCAGWPPKWGSGFCVRRRSKSKSRKEIQMKSIISFVVVISFIASAIAQEESPSPSVEEKASATVEESPAASPTEHAAATPAESPAAQKKETPASTTPKK